MSKKSNKYNVILNEIPYFEIVNKDNSIFSFDVIASNKIIIQPKFNFGFTHLIHSTKNQMERLINVNTVYRVTNPFEHKIVSKKENEKSIEDYFDENIVSRAYFKLWEILILFDIIPNSKSFTSVHLAEAPGAFVQCTSDFRKRFFDSKKDIYHAISLYPGKDALEYDKELSKKLGDKFKPYKTTEKNTGDLMDLEQINKFVDDIKSDVNFITGDGGFPWKDENYQEQEYFPLLLGQIITALKIQEIGGSFVCKLFEMFTIPTNKLIFALSSLYEKFYIIKPQTSRPSNSERYIVAKGFNGISKKQMKLLERILTEKDFIWDIFIDFELPNDYVENLIKFNVHLANIQMEHINDTLNFLFDGKEKKINKNDIMTNQNFTKYRERQAEASKKWAKLFVPNNVSELKLLRLK